MHLLTAIATQQRVYLGITHTIEHYHSYHNIYIANFIQAWCARSCRLYSPNNNYPASLASFRPFIYEFDKRDWKYICHVASS